MKKSQVPRLETVGPPWLADRIVDDSAAASCDLDHLYPIGSSMR